MSSVFNSQNIERMRVNGNEIALAKINGNVVFQKNKLLKTFFGDSKQNVTQGYNELEPKMETSTRLGVTCTNNGDGSFTLNGTAQYNTDFRINQSTVLGLDNLMNLNGEYTLKCDNQLIEGVMINITQNETWKNPLIINHLTNKSSYNFENFDNCFVDVYIYQGTILNNFTIKPFLYKGTEDKPYEPYTGGKPSPNPDYPQQIKSITGASLKLTGKNLYDNEYTNNIVSNEGVITPNPNWNMSDYIEVESNKSYTFSHNDNNSTGQSLMIIEFDENKNFIKRNSQGNYNYETYEPYTIITNSNTKFIILNYNNTYNNSLFQLEKGSQVTTYEPYKVQTIPVNLQGNILAKVGDYADELQIYSNGDVKLVKKTGEILLNGTESKWSFVESGSIWPFRYVNEEIKFNNSNFTVFNYLCDYYIPKSATMYNNSIGQLGLTQSVCFRNDSIESLEEFKEWLSLHNTKVFFQLEEILEPKRIQNIKEELNQFGDYSNIEIETTYS